MYIRVLPSSPGFTGEAKGEVRFVVESPPADGETEPRRSTVVLPVKVGGGRLGGW